MKSSRSNFATAAVAAVFGFLPMLGTAHAAPMIVNGDFEAVQVAPYPAYFSSNPAEIPGWTHYGDPGDALMIHAGGYAYTCCAGHGSQFVIMGGGFYNPDNVGHAGWTTQITGLTPGNSYSLNFMIASETFSQTMTVGFDSGSSTPSQQFTAPASDYPSGSTWNHWIQESLVFVATATTATPDFSVVNTGKDMGLDCVAVDSTCADATPVPEPSTLAMLATGLLALGALSWRRRDRGAAPIGPTLTAS